MDATGRSPSQDGQQSQDGGTLRSAGDAFVDPGASRQPDQLPPSMGAIGELPPVSQAFGGQGGFGDMAQLAQSMGLAPPADGWGGEYGGQDQGPGKGMYFGRPQDQQPMWGTGSSYSTVGSMSQVPLDLNLNPFGFPSFPMPMQPPEKPPAPAKPPQAAEAKKYPSRTMEEFNFMDVNKDGFITMDEFLGQKQDWAEMELENIKVQTMQKMVTSVTYTVGDQQGTCQMLYLSNKQAASIPQSNMEKVREVLDIKDPKLVIRLMPSRFGKAYWQAFPNWGARFPTKSRSEVREEDEKNVDHQLMLLAKEVLLPLAMRTNALIIGSESCSLTAAFAQACEPVQRLMGEGCPFRMILFTKAHFLDTCSKMPTKTAYSFRQATKRWRNIDFTDSLKDRFGDDPAYWPSEDILPGCSQVVVFECLGDRKKGPSVMTADRFQTDFVTSLAAYLPVIGLQTQGEDRMFLMPAMADHVNRGLPLMLLDSRRRRTKPSDLKGVMAELDLVRNALHAQGRIDLHTTSLLTFVKSMMVRRRHQTDGSNEEDEQKEKDMWLWEAIVNMKRLRTERQKALALGKERIATTPGSISGGPSSGMMGGGKCMTPQSRETSHTPEERSERDALKQQELVDAVNAVMQYVGLEQVFEAEVLERRCQDAIDTVRSSASWDEFKRNWDEKWCAIRGCAFHKYDSLHKLADAHAWCEMHDFGKDTPAGRYMLVIHTPGQWGHAPGAVTDHTEAVELLLGEVEKAFTFVKSLHRRSKTLKAFMQQEEIWLAVYDIMKATNVRCGNLYNIQGCKAPIDSMAQIDRLPGYNSLEAMVLLRNAWTLRDVFAVNADWYKRTTKAAYFIFCLLSTAIVITTTLSVLYPEVINNELLQHILLGFALVSSFCAGWTTYLDPSKKWLILRGGSLELESEIWRFRSRIGEYGGTGSTIGREEAEREAERHFQAAIVSVRGRVLESASLKESGFYAVPTSTDDIYIDVETADRRPKPPPAGVKGCFSKCCGCCRRRRTGPERKVATRGHTMHGQYPGNRRMGARPGPGEDNFHSPVRPDAYVRWRLIPVLRFYQRRIPSYSRRRVLNQAGLICSSIISTLLAAVGMSRWASIVAALAAALAAWQEFSGISKKLGRYSSTCESLGKLLLWWQSLGEVEQNNLRHIEALVNGVEELAANEAAAWLSAVQSSLKELAKLEAGAEKGEKSA